MPNPTSKLATVAAIAAVAVFLLGGCAATASDASASQEPTGTPAASAPLLDDALRTQLEAALDEGFAASGMPGVVVGLWIPGEDEWVSARGVADTETGAPMSRENQQKIGSITKTIVSTVVLQVIGDGFDVSLDDTLDRWYPDFPEASKITVRMLLNHSSGVAEAGRAQVDRICAAPHAIPSPDQLIAVSAQTPRADFAPGEGFEYANGNYFLLGGILEQVTGENLETLIHDRITEPFGMDRSRYALDGMVVDPVTHGYSLFCPELGDQVDTVGWSNGESGAGGAMVSTLDDLHAWGDALGAGAGVTPELQAERYADRAIISEATSSAYGLGTGIVYDAETDCVLSVAHAGAEPGYGTNVAYYPPSGAVLALLGNGDGGDGDAAAKVTTALTTVLWPVLAGSPNAPCEAPWG
ncbi:serine hydrolase domain-containing protein [Agromyces sp. NPDC058110]|uniref:serine hydrolase domain-containing protein n=1 Tax=Agromyces sp. NPDC058110 TaxID=3346345 RepID=UPI0036DB79EB